MNAGDTVWCPPPTSLALLWKFSPNLISDIIRKVICWNPIGRSSFLPSNYSKIGCTLFISCKIAFHHRVSPLSLSIWNASCTVFRVRIPYLCVLCQYLIAVMEIIWSHFFNTCLVHQLNAGSSEILFWTAHLASWIG